jgi:predicted dehydrogenase
MTKTGVAIIGTGNIASGYVKDLLTYPEIEVTGVTDIDQDRARKFASEHHVHAYPSGEALLADSRVQIAVNLTSHFAHKAVTEAALQAGKHVHSEKPLALTSDEAWELVALARKNGLRLACSPFTIIGEAQQTAWKMIRDGALGKVRVVYADVNWGRIESWHPAPIPFYEVGAMFDVGVYPLALVTSMFGPARRVWTFGKVLYPDRVTKDGTPYRITTPDWMVTLLELADGTQVRLTTDFYVSNETTRQTGLEFHGDLGSMHLESAGGFNSALSFARFGEPLTPVPALLREPYRGIPWGRGVHELVCALAEGRPHRFSGEQAAHITDILNAANQSMKTGQPVPVTSSFDPPAPADWARA